MEKHEIEKAEVRIDDTESYIIATITYKGKNDIINCQYLELKKLYDEFVKYQKLEHKQYKIIATNIKAQAKSIETIIKIRNKDKED